MLNSSVRKMTVSGWLKKHHSEEFSSPLKLQKFLFFYEAYSKIEDDSSEFKSLKGYPNGPVFSDVYGDYRYRSDDFSLGAEEAYEIYKPSINEERAKFSGFLVKIQNELELSDLTHELNIWNSKKSFIERGDKQIPLDEKDLNSSDADFLLSLREMYPIEYIDSVKVIQISGKSFIINHSDVERLTEEQCSLFTTLAKDDNLTNPVYVTLDEDGVVLVD